MHKTCVIFLNDKHVMTLNIENMTYDYQKSTITQQCAMIIICYMKAL